MGKFDGRRLCVHAAGNERYWEPRTVDHYYDSKRNKRTEGHQTDPIRKLYVKADELARGQTMTEYALILGAVAVVVFAGYQVTGSTLSTLVSAVDTQL